LDEPCDSPLRVIAKRWSGEVARCATPATFGM